MNVSIKLPDYIPTWLKISMVTFLIFCVAGLPFWIFVVDEIQEFAGERSVPVSSNKFYSSYESNPSDSITKKVERIASKMIGD
jgi:hypothetical protein